MTNLAMQAPVRANPGIMNVFSSEGFDKLTDIMYFKIYDKGAAVFWEDDRANNLYFIKKGRVRLTKTADDGRTITLYLYQTGDLFGQLDPFQDSVHGFNAGVMEKSEIGIIRQKDLQVLLWRHGRLAIEFIKWMGLAHRRTQTKFRDLMMFGKPGALCSLLIRLGNSYGVQEGQAIKIAIKLNHTELADMIGATRECVNRMFSEFKKEGVVSVKDGFIYIKDIAYLRDICRCELCPKEICRV